MYESLVKSSGNSIIEIAERTIPEIAALVKLDKSPEQFLDHVCAGLDALNHVLGKPVQYTQSDMVESLQQEFPGVPREIWEAVGIWSAAGIVAAFNLVIKVYQESKNDGTRRQDYADSSIMQNSSYN